MKKLLLIALICSQSIIAQVILTEDFSTYLIGNVGIDFTGMTPTQNAFTIATNGDAPTTATNAGNDNFKIIDNGIDHGSVLQITGTNGDKGSRELWPNGIAGAWSLRNSENNILEIEFDMYTGNTSGTSLNTMGLYIYDETKTKILGGYSFNTKTLVLSGVAYWTTGIGNYFFTLNSGGTNLVLPANTWVRLGVSFNYITGSVKWKGSTHSGQIIGAAAYVDPDRTSLISYSGTTTLAPIVTNTAAAIGLFDNFVIRFVATDGLLGVAENVLVDNASFTVYPNPANNSISVSSRLSAAITSIAITDMNGRIIKSQTYDNLADVVMNIADLANGMYMMNIVSKEGNYTQKIIKN